MDVEIGLELWREWRCTRTSRRDLGTMHEQFRDIQREHHDHATKPTSTCSEAIQCCSRQWRSYILRNSSDNSPMRRSSSISPQPLHSACHMCPLLTYYHSSSSVSLLPLPINLNPTNPNPLPPNLLIPSIIQIQASSSRLSHPRISSS